MKGVLPDYRRAYRAGYSSGFTLIEVLVAVLLLSVGILGLVALETIALQSNQNALLRSQASVLAYDLADKMRANKQAAWARDYDIALGASLTEPASNCIDFSGGNGYDCSTSDIAARELYDWTREIQARFPLGRAGVVSESVAVGSGVARAYTIEIRWDEDRDGSIEVNAADDHPDEQFVLTFTL